MRLLVTITVAALLGGSVANAQVGVEAGILTGGNAGTIGGFAGLGASISLTAARIQSVIKGAITRHAAPSTVQINSLNRSYTRNFVPTVEGTYVVGVDWASPSPTPVTLRAGGAQVQATAEAPVTLQFTPAVRQPCAIALETQGDLPPAGLQADVQIVRQPGPGEPQLKSLLTPQQRASAWTRRGPQASLLPLTANLAARHCAGVADKTDLDQTFEQALGAVPAATPEDLEALVQSYDSLSEEARVEAYTADCRALRTAESPRAADVPEKLRKPTEEVAGDTAAPTASGGETGVYLVTFKRLECVDESNPEWWGSDNVGLLWTVVADQQVATGGSAIYGGFDDGVQQELSQADQATFREAVTVGTGLGLVIELWEWEAEAPASGLRTWAIRESLARSLVTPQPDYTHPKVQNSVSRELSVVADLIGQARLIWSADELAKLVSPGQASEQVVDLRPGTSALEYDAAGYYRLHLLVERVN